MLSFAHNYMCFFCGENIKISKHSGRNKALCMVYSRQKHIGHIATNVEKTAVAYGGGAEPSHKLLTQKSPSSTSNLTSHHYCLYIFTLFSWSSFPRNLLAADAEGSLSIYDADPFVHLKTVKVHKKAVNSLSVHPSGKLALTVGHDECLAMVNLVRGRRSFYCRLNKESSIVQFDETGEKFFMVVDEKISVHESEDAKLILELDNKKRVLCASPGANGILFTGGEDRNVTAWDTASGKVAYSIEDAHAARVKGIVVLSKSNNDSGEEDPYIVASASSDGVIRVWDVRMANKGKPNPLTEANTKSRLTCLAGSSIKSLKRPRLENLNPDGKTDVAAAEL
ncbi:hypothetical protein BUALT_Bualt03G0023100 [Buddleja alternifolia]|uniref:P21-activated protein kinase-interacting protein 1-like n=1 Tax=Buddleja alternifolia TaxID=168488 RepID=A0AAV6XQJ5_9LAMI|nr:hypothetical protein BUALT_Bualt03G0023100 [Buddleja alternifolia]